ncbi:MAG: HAD family hydrolase [Loktanella sp.]|nr:HAD family hydrolase [Loktanella sp.]
MIAGIIFDKDGTLFDFNATWGAWTRAMLIAEAGDDPILCERLAAVLGYDMVNARFFPGSIVIASTVDDVADAILDVVPARDKSALLARMNAGSAKVDQVEAVPLRPYTAQLRQIGLTLGVATNDAEAPAVRHLERAGIRADFDFVAGYDSGFGAKPGPGQLLGFCRTTGLAPQACVMVGDSTHDLHAGRAAGMMTIAVLTGPAPREELAALADVVLADIGDIPAWLQREKLIAS